MHVINLKLHSVLHLSRKHEEQQIKCYCIIRKCVALLGEVFVSTPCFPDPKGLSSRWLGNTKINDRDSWIAVNWSDCETASVQLGCVPRGNYCGVHHSRTMLTRDDNDDDYLAGIDVDINLMHSVDRPMFTGRNVRRISFISFGNLSLDGVHSRNESTTIMVLRNCIEFNIIEPHDDMVRNFVRFDYNAVLRCNSFLVTFCSINQHN